MTDTTQAQAGAAAATPAASETIRPLKNRYTLMKWVLVAYMIGEFGLFLGNSGEMYFLFDLGADVYESDTPPALAVILTTFAAGILQVVTLFASYILVSMWTYRAMKNLHIIGDTNAEMSPGWAVGWYFIPFANLWKPFEGMLQIWRGSHHQAGESEKVPAYVGWWWATWLIGNFLSNIAVRLGGFMGDGADYDTSLWFYGASSLVAVVCTLLLLKTAGQVTRMQAQMKEDGLASVFS